MTLPTILAWADFDDDGRTGGSYAIASLIEQALAKAKG